MYYPRKVGVIDTANILEIKRPTPFLQTSLEEGYKSYIVMTHVIAIFTSLQCTIVIRR